MLKKFYRLLVVLLSLSILFAGVATPATAAAWRDKVDPWVLKTAGEGETEFLVYLTTQADLSGARDSPTKLEKGNYVYQTLTSVAAHTQGSLIAELQKLGVEYHPYWIANLIWVRAGLSTVQLLASRLDVAHLYANPQVALDAPVKQDYSSAQPNGIEWNISWVNAPQVWDLGFTGQGTVIGGQDTGYAWDHPAIKNQYRGWNGITVDHNYNWIDATAQHSQVPIDPYFHGTHTMGTMVGDDGGNNQIGMAPGARWIGCRNMDADGFGTPETYTACYQWFVAPTRLDGSEPRTDLAPDVINNSWGCPPSEGCNPNSLLLPVQNLVAAGIVSAHSAGNSGYFGCGSISDPAAIYDESFTVGATGYQSNVITDFSSLGPVTVDGSNRPKPDISAPGEDVRSSIPGGGYAIYSGTSMAGPHVAGLVALLISAHPSLRGQVDEIESTIEQSALHIPWTGCSSSGVPNNTYGWGRIDALAAVQIGHQLELIKTTSQASVYPGDNITYTLTITHAVGITDTTNVVLTDTLPAETAFITATMPYTLNGNVIQWDFDRLEPLGTRSVNLEVKVNLTAVGEVANSDYAVQSDQVATLHGQPVITALKKLDVLQLDKSADPPIAFPGGLITYTLAVENSHDLLTTTNVVLTDTLPAGTVFIFTSEPYSMNGDIIRWDIPSILAGDTHQVTLVVRVNMDEVGSITNTDYAVYSDQAELVRGAPVITQIGKVYFLPLAIKSP